MNKKNRVLIVLSSILLLCLMAGVVFAAYRLIKRTMIDTVDAGQISVDSKKFISYASGDMRVDTVVDVDDVKLLSTDNYALTSDTTFQTGKTYYVVGTYERASVNIGDSVTADTYYEDQNGSYSYTTDTTFQSGTIYYTKTSNNGYTATTTITIGASAVGYYEKTVTYTGVDTIATLKTTTDTTGTNLSYEKNALGTVVTIKSSGTTIAIVTLTFDTTGISSGTATIGSSSDYRVVVDADGMGFIVIDNTKTIGSEVTGDTVTCSATSNKLTASNLYLNQLGLEFTFTNEIAVYVRIHIQDAWIATRQYSSNVSQKYSIKDQIAGNSPFAVSDSGWYYDAKENTAYMLAMVSAVKDDDGDYVSHSFTFDVNEAYYYISSNKTSVYTEYVDVEVSFTVDLVQANRAKDIWKIDPSALGNN